MDIGTILLYIFTNFEIAFVSDIVLNDLATYRNMLPFLKPYFAGQSIVECGVAAGLTVVVGLVLTMIAAYNILGFWVPNTVGKLTSFSILGFILGYLLDILIKRNRIFGNRLDAYYKKMGAGLWGGIAFVFCIVISYFIQKNILNKL